jgi:hypothetical protein
VKTGKIINRIRQREVDRWNRIALEVDAIQTKELLSFIQSLSMRPFPDLSGFKCARSEKPTFWARFKKAIVG